MTRVLSLRAPSAPLLSIAAAEQILRLDATTRAALRSILLELRTSSRWEGDRAWRKRKGPMALYRHEIARHATLLARALRQPGELNEAGSLPHRPGGNAAEHDQRKPRSSRACVRNPLLRLDSIVLIQRLPATPRGQLRALLQELARACAGLAEQCWDREDRSLALYWRTAAVYAGHLARTLKGGLYDQCEMPLDFPAATPAVGVPRAA